MKIRRAKISATLGPATESPAVLRALITAGADVLRINMSHGEHAQHAEWIKNAREASVELKRPVAIMIDLCGPRLRTGGLKDGQALLTEGAEVRIVPGEEAGDSSRISMNYDKLPREINTGDRILISDGDIELAVTSTTSSEVLTRVVRGGMLGEHKGVNLPAAHLSIPSITEKDHDDLRFGIEHGADIVAQSFVRTAADCKLARELISRFGGSAWLIAKIEKPEAVDDLDNILEASDGVIVARGDLAVETSLEEVPLLQKHIISEALLAEKITITATQMLKSMVENPRPTRAEASDIANAIIDGSDGLLLSNETAVGKYPVESVAMMSRIIQSTEDGTSSSNFYSADFIKHTLFGRGSGSIGRAIAEAAVFAAEEANCRLIVVITQSGHMARRIASLRPEPRIIALTPHENTISQLPTVWGIEPYKLDDFEADNLVAAADAALLKHSLAQVGDIVVVMAGQLSDPVISNSMKLHKVGELINM